MGKKIAAVTMDNAKDVLCWLPEFGVLVCKAHGFAVHNISDHLRHLHRGTTQERKEVVSLFAGCYIRQPQDVSLPEPLNAPFECLGKPIRAFICDEPECGKISKSRDAIRIHCNREHEWKSTKAEREHWHRVWAQTFFSSAGLQRYFTVDYEEEVSDEGNDEGERFQLATNDGTRTYDDVDEDEMKVVLSDWNTQSKKREKELEIADDFIAKTDHTLWFKRNQWPEHIKGCNLRHLSQATRLPDRDEELLLQAVEANTTLLERCVKGLSTLDLETRRWLRSAKQNEPDVRPFARLQNEGSQVRYGNYFARLICYALRVLASEEGQGHDRDGDTSSSEDEGESSNSEGEDNGSTTDDDSEAGDSRHSAQVSTDVMKDARTLFPWRGRQKELLQTFRDSLRGGVGDELEQDALLEFYRSVIFQRVRGDVFSSVLLHYLAILGIDEELNRLRTANDFSYMLAGVVYCTRALAIEVLLPSAERDEQGEKDDREFIKMRGEYLADGSFSAMSKMLSLLAYSKSLAFNHSNAGAVFWTEDRLTMTYQGNPIELAGFRRFVQSVIDDGEDVLWAKLLLCRKDERFELPLEDYRDDVTFTKRGWSFVRNKQNGLEGKHEWLLRRLLSRHNRIRRDGTWSKAAVKKYLRGIEHFRELLLLIVHMCGGQPARGSEITSIRFRNGFMQDRNVFVVHGQVVVVTRYHKSQSQLDKPKVIPRFLPWRVGQIMAIYLAYVQPMQDYLIEQAGGAGWTDYVWAGEHGAWETDRLTRVMKRESQKRLGLQLTTHDYRHVAISIGREVVGAGFAQGYQEGMDENTEEEEVEEDGDALEVSAGRGGEVGANRYGVPMDVIKHLSNKTIDTFRPLSAKWHEFLGLASRGRAGKKRSLHARGESVEVEAEALHSERRIVMAARNNSLGTTGLRLAEWARSSNVERVGEWDFNRASSAALMPSTPQRSSLAIRSSPSQSSTQQRSTSSARGSSELQARVSYSKDQIQAAMRKALQAEEVSFRSEEQQEALETIINSGRMTPLVVILPTGGGKSLLFMAPACLDDAGVTIVVVPYRALINNLVKTAQKAGINSMEWRPGEQNPAALVFVSADLVSIGSFMGYAQLLSMKGLLRRVLVDECHLTFTASDWRPKLAHVQEVRKLKCPTIMLTATLPETAESDLEECMKAEGARYIRARTTRKRTRYIVHEVKVGTLEKECVALAVRIRKHLRFRKGVVYSRSRDQCERLAKELNCAYYHAGSVDNEEQLQHWLRFGGLIIATSALGTGVDFPGVVFILHVDLPYGMIDFAQESGRGGRAGEEVDSIVMIEQGRVSKMAKQFRGVDDTVMGDFATTRGCRRLLMSVYLDGTAVECGEELARCDNCGEGLTSVQRKYMQDALERQQFEQQLDELADRISCLDCFVAGADDPFRTCFHEADRCPHQGQGGGVVVGESDVEALRKRMQFERKTHSCFKCGMSQAICRTGQDSKSKCQWPRVCWRLLRRIGDTEGGLEVLRGTGFSGSWGDWDEYAGWLSRAHTVRVWREVMSNAMVSLIRFMSWRMQQMETSWDHGAVPVSDGERIDRDYSNAGQEDELEAPHMQERRSGFGSDGDEGDSVEDGMQHGARNDDDAQADDMHTAGAGRAGRRGEFINKLRQWQGVCLVCKAGYGVEIRTHESMSEKQS